MERMRDVTISDPKYEGVKTSRKALFDQDDDDAALDILDSFVGSRDRCDVHPSFMYESW